MQDHKKHISKDAAQNTAASNVGETDSTRKDQSVGLKIQPEPKDDVVVPRWIYFIILRATRIIEKLLKKDIVDIDESSQVLLLKLNPWVLRLLGFFMFIWTIYKFFF